jgi:uncharacterized protein (DUF427 family)
MMNSTSTSHTCTSGYTARPDYRVDLLQQSNRIEVSVGPRRLASSENAIVVDEQDHAAVVYLPREDVDMAELIPVLDRSTHCPVKGDAHYWALAEAPGYPVAWSYETPYPQVAALAHYIAFYQDKVDVLIRSKVG